MISPEELESAKGKILEIIGERIPLRRSGANWTGKCLWHDDRHPSFTVSEKRKTWMCWACNCGGDALDFVQKFHGTDFRGALAILGIKDDDRDPERSRQFMRALEEISRDENTLLERLERREGDLQFFSKHVNWLIAYVPPLEREARWYSWERWLDEEFDGIERERERIREIARRHRREVSQWAQKAR